MCSSDFGLFDCLLEREDSSKSDDFLKSLFWSPDHLKSEPVDCDWKLSHALGEDFFHSVDDLFVKEEDEEMKNVQGESFLSDDLETPDADLDLPSFDPSDTASSDSGLDSHLDFLLSPPSSSPTHSEPQPNPPSPDVCSEVSSSSDVDVTAQNDSALSVVPSSPEVTPPKLVMKTAPLVPKTSPSFSFLNGQVLKTISIPASALSRNSDGSQTVVLSKGAINGSINKTPTVLKVSPSAPRSILLPVKDLSQIRTIKIISNGNSKAVRTIAVRPSTTTTTVTTTPLRTTVLNSVRNLLSPSSVVEESSNDSTSCAGPYQKLILSAEEKKLMVKEGIVLPTHYPLTKQEERELKRIRRKIRNKISAQDSRKRKKEYIDGLQDRVKACTVANEQLQKRIKHLEAQNATLVNQVKRFQTLITGGTIGRSQAHASTALMMLILSAALIIVPSLRHQDPAADSDLTLPAKMPAAGHSRSLLEATQKSFLSKDLGSDFMEEINELDGLSSITYSDHDYYPNAKRQKTEFYETVVGDIPENLARTDSGDNEPPDKGSAQKLLGQLMSSVLQHFGNYSETRDNPKTSSVILDIDRGGRRLRDDIELE